MKKQMGDFTKFDFSLGPLSSSKAGGHYKESSDEINMLSIEEFFLWMQQSEDKSNFVFFTHC